MRIQRVLDGEDALAMVFQRIVDLRAGTTVGYEALARFAGEPSRPPDLWFRDAAEVGLGLELERLAVCKALERLPSLAPELFLSVNSSPELVASAGFLTALEGAATDRIVVEITEHAPVHDYPRLARALDVLRDRGVGVAIDDAGAGFASLRHILELAPTFIKLDISITRDISTPAGESVARCGARDVRARHRRDADRRGRRDDRAARRVGSAWRTARAGVLPGPVRSRWTTDSDRSGLGSAPGSCFEPAPSGKTTKAIGSCRPKPEIRGRTSGCCWSGT